FIGGAVAYRRRDHAFVRVVLNTFPERVQRACYVLADVLVLFTAGLVAVSSVEFLAASWTERTPILQVPAALIGSPLPLGMLLIAFYAIAHLASSHGKLAWSVAAAFPPA